MDIVEKTTEEDVQSAPNDRKESKPIWSLTRRIRKYLHSYKGKELIIQLSTMYCLSLVTISLALVLSLALAEHTVGSSIFVFYILMHCVSITCVLVLLLLGQRGKLTNDDTFKNQKSTNFTRAGSLGLGTGGMIYYAVTIATVIYTTEECKDVTLLIHSVTGLSFIAIEISLLFKYSKVRINKNLGVSVLARLLIMQVIATNLCTWLLTVVIEATEEISHHDEVDLNITQTELKSKTTYSWSKQCRKDSELRFIIMPYTFPLLIEFNVMASALALAIWDNCGNGLRLETDEEDEDDIGEEETKRRQFLAARLRSLSVATIQIDSSALNNRRRPRLSSSSPSSSRDSSFVCESDESLNIGRTKKNYPDNNKGGFILGWIIICTIVGLVIVSLYIMYSTGDPSLDIEHTIYAANLSLSLLCLLVIPFTFKRISILTFEDDEIKILLELKHDTSTHFKQNIHHKVDNNLLIITLLALFAFKIFSGIAAYEQQSYLILLDSIFSMLAALVQTFFIVYAQNKRSKSEMHLQTRPGKQGLEFLRCTNFSLWLINTFLLKHPKAKRVQNLTFEYLPWSVLSNTFQPLAILYYFHTIVCFAEILGRAYTDKFVGFVRPSKRKISCFRNPQRTERTVDFAIGSDL